jgi:putative phosphoribosyl transferase
MNGKRGGAVFRDRQDAGIRLSDKLKAYKDNRDALVLALPRGGVATGFEIARLLNLPLDVLIVRKIGAPWQPELAAGAVSETGTVVINQNVVSAYGIPKEYMEKEIARQKDEISRRISLYRKGKGIGGLEGKIVLLVDDGVATGATMKSAVLTLKQEKLKKLVIALPVAPPETADELRKKADELICLETPGDFMAVGAYYQDFTQVSDDEVVKMLKDAEGGFEGRKCSTKPLHTTDLS